MILDETIKLIKERYSAYSDNLAIADVRVGTFLTAVKLSNGNAGVSGTLPPQSNEVHREKDDRDFSDFTPLQITGKQVMALLESPKTGSLVTSLKFAALSAISSGIPENRNYKMLKNTDPVDLIDLNVRQTITIVGAFQSYIRRISQSGNRLFVLELNSDFLSPAHQKYFVPANEFEKVLPVSDTVIITGSALVNRTFENLLAAVKPGARVIVTGPSVSCIPDVMFSKGVHIVGSLKATNPELMLKVAGEGGTGYHLFRYCAEKICYINE